MISIKDYNTTSTFFSLLLWLKSKETIDNVNNHTKENGFVINMVSHTLLAIQVNSTRICWPRNLSRCLVCQPEFVDKIDHERTRSSKNWQL